MLVAQNSLGPVCPVPLTVRGKSSLKDSSLLAALSKIREAIVFLISIYARAVSRANRWIILEIQRPIKLRRLPRQVRRDTVRMKR